ncbi:deoxynucleoside kinase [Psychrobacter sp. Ps2]|uniref:deoxynucleoside kinase n=1 Tax=Psychrobacter sp. Ps2 TaxID=2790956 RepID=UPI001EE0D4EA|nr:deoxynucleoside kinase [Psychrobacter sp. Ps2]MCG3858831.1 deoxynucleoside kinase [Psychrobacter sp. Ps2]
MYIAIEGLKGTGKSTLLKTLLPVLKARLQPKQHRIAILHPTKPIPEDHYLEREFYQHQNNDDYLRLLYAARSNYHASRTDWNANLIISDRSILTSLAVRWRHTNLSPVEHYKQVRAQESVIAIPDLVIQLDAPNATLLKRYAKRNRQYGQHEETLDSIVSMRSSYTELYKWLSTEQTMLLLDKSIPIYSYDTSEMNVQGICQDITDVIEQNFANINSESLVRKSYSLVH